MSISFKGKVVLITGAASGIGRATALAFAREGAQVVIADLAEDGNEETARLIRDAGGEAHAVTADMSKPEDIERMVAEAVQTYGRLDVACNNAGIEGDQAFTADFDEAEWGRILDINLKGVWLCMKHQIPHMLEAGGGAIVNVSSIAGIVGLPGIPAYVSSKHGVNGLTKTTALEYAAEGIRVNSVCPGAIETPMISRYFEAHPEGRDALITQHPIGRIGRSEEVAETILWLSSDAASFITGQIIAVDGGYTAR